MIVQADARNLPWEDASFDLILTSPPWDDLDVFTQARPELSRVLKKRGLVCVLLPNLADPDRATLAVANRDWTQRQEFGVEKPRTDNGGRYWSPSDEFVAGVLSRYRPRQLLDPFCGTGTIPRVARALGIDAHGSDLVAA